MDSVWLVVNGLLSVMLKMTLPAVQDCGSLGLRELVLEYRWRQPVKVSGCAALLPVS